MSQPVNDTPSAEPKGTAGLFFVPKSETIRVSPMAETGSPLCAALIFHERHKAFDELDRFIRSAASMYARHGERQTAIVGERVERWLKDNRDAMMKEALKP